MPKLHTIRILGSAFLPRLPRTIHFHGVATAGAMLTCAAIVLNVGPFCLAPGKAPKTDSAPANTGRAAAAMGLQSAEPGTRAAAAVPHPEGPQALRWDTAALSHAHGARAPSTSEPDDITARISALTSLLPFAALANGSSQAASGYVDAKVVQVVWDEPAAQLQPAAQPQPEADAQLQSDQPHDATRDPVVGVWSPDGSCSARNFRGGSLPTVVNPDGAWAGETFCLFTNRKQTDAGWTVVAKCTNPQERWTSNVRLTVNDNRLTWASRRGTQTYARCAPDVAMAHAR